MQPASAPEIQPAVSLLAKTPQILETLLGDLLEELLHWKPNPDRWSISEVLAHLSALEEVYGERVRRMVSEDSPSLARYDLEGWASHDLGHLRQIEELYRARVFHPNSGPFTKYSHLQP